MSKIKWYKYVLTSAILFVACACFALADGPTVATVNGQPYDSLATALGDAGAGDSIVVISDCDFDARNVSVPSGAHLLIPDGVTVSTVTRTMNVYGDLTLYGNLIRSGDSSPTAAFVLVDGGDVTVYGNVVSTQSTGRPIGVTSQGGNVTIYGGTFTGASSMFTNYGLITVYSGTFNPGISVSDHLVLAPGVSRVPGTNSYSWGSLYHIGLFVHESLQWLALFCAMIVANKLLLIFLLVVFSALGIGLIKRVVR